MPSRTSAESSRNSEVPGTKDQAGHGSHRGIQTELDGILPKDEYFALTRTSNTLLVELLKNFSRIPADANGDIFGKIYEFFLAGISGLTGFSRCTASMCWIAIPRSRKS